MCVERCGVDGEVFGQLIYSCNPRGVSLVAAAVLRQNVLRIIGIDIFQTVGATRP